MSEDSRLRAHPRERLAAAIQRVDLREASARLRSEPHASVSGHRQLAIVRRGPVSVILFAFEEGGLLKEHQADGDVIIQVLTGQLSVTVDDEAVTLGPNALLTLAPGQPHSVRAIEDSDMLLTICRAPSP